MSSNLLAFLIILAIFIGIGLWLTPWVWYDNTAKPLGDRLEYVGKHNYGCVVGFCDSKPGATYYYATDMSVEDTIHYFQKAKLAKEPQQESKSTYVQMKRDNTNFTFDYYDVKNKDQLGPFEKKFSNKNVVDINANDYQAAKNSL